MHSLHARNSVTQRPGQILVSSTYYTSRNGLGDQATCRQANVQEGRDHEKEREGNNEGEVEV